MTTEIIWTALPRGRTGNVLHVSVHVAPRFTPDGVLADHPPFPAWPPADLVLKVKLPGTTAIAGVDVTSPERKPALWSALFGPSTPVIGYAPTDWSLTPIHSYPLAEVVDFLKAQYTKIAVDSPDSFPAINSLLANGFENLSFAPGTGTERFNHANNVLHEQLAGPEKVAGAAPNTVNPDTYAFVQVEDFFAPSDPKDPAFHQPVELPQLDFHRVLAFVGQHPNLQRLLGMVFDLDVDTSGVALPDGPTTITVVPESAALATTTAITPLTHCVIDPDSFGLASQIMDEEGLFHFFDHSNDHHVQVVDADGAAIKAVDFASDLTRKMADPTADASDTSPLPSLRSQGFSVTLSGKAKQLHDKLVTNHDIEGDLTTNTVEVSGDDLVRGSRVDVWDSRSQRWHSLMDRTGGYDVAGVGDIAVQDEGILTVAPTQKPGSDDLYLSEEMFWWDGWSLAAPRPGKILDRDPQASPPLIDQPDNAPDTDFPITIHFDATPQSLPMLRFGTDYRFRSRAVDIAGNSAPLGDPASGDFSHATAPTTYRRFEPVQAPTVLLRHPRGPGESVQVVALRSNWDVDPVPDTAERHLTPTKVGQHLIEQHGLLDAPDPDDPTKIVLAKDRYLQLVALDNATLADVGALDPDDYDGTRYYGMDEVPTAWAPDPIGRGVALRLLDGPNAGFVDRYAFDAAAGWPNYKPIRLSVVEGSGPPVFQAGVLHVPLRKGEQVTARVSNWVDLNDVDLLGVWDWIRHAPGADLGLLRDKAEYGQHWMLTPFRTLRLVHAVRQPLLAPDFANLPSPTRKKGETFATFFEGGTLKFSRASTARVDILGSWSEPVDNGPGTSAPFTKNPDGIAFTLDVDLDGPPDTIPIKGRHEFGDTKHRVVTYRATAITRFPEFFKDRATFPYDGPSSSVVLDPSGESIVPGSVTVILQSPDGTRETLIEGTHFTAAATPPATIDFQVAAPAKKSPEDRLVVVTYLLTPIVRDTVTPKALSVPSSARPAAPKVLYIVPTFGWASEPVVNQSGTVGRTSTRHGNGLRVYLDRPWWSSGEGELLGVVTWPGAELVTQPDLDGVINGEEWEDPVRPYVTQWGDDPIFKATPTVTRYPQLSSFPNAVTTVSTGLSIEELPGTLAPTVHVAGHTVGYDTDRQLWYCDIHVDPGDAYQPFVRLALARFQPQSIGGAELSRIVLAEFTQLAPDRFATVVWNANASPPTASVTITGPSPIQTEVSGKPGVARVFVEQADPSIGGDLGWHQVGSPVELVGTQANGQATWTGSVVLPGAPGAGTLRLVLEQYELLGLEKKTNNANPFLPGIAERLVYSDIVPM